MPYYHVTNKKVIAALEELYEQYTEQRKVCRHVMRKLKVNRCWLDDYGMHGIEVKDRSKYDSRVWCAINLKKFGPNCLRPRATRAGKEMRELLEKVPEVDNKNFWKPSDGPLCTTTARPCLLRVQRAWDTLKSLDGSSTLVSGPFPS